MSAKKAKPKLLLTHRALSDIAELKTYSVKEWGRRNANKYLADIESALERLQEAPELLRPEAGLHRELCFYRVNKHLLACDVDANAIIVLTVIHASRDIPSRLAELQPSLIAEVELLRNKLPSGKTR